MFAKRVLILGSLALLCACGDVEKAASPIEITRETACSLDGMLLADYPGPKGQIQYLQGPPDFFCDTMELLSIYLKPEQQKRVKAVYVQDMGATAWEKPEGHWTDARTAFFVAGSKRMGSMGPTFASFAREEDAQRFAQSNGGRVLKFADIKPDMVTLDGGALHDEKM